MRAALLLAVMVMINISMTGVENDCSRDEEDEEIALGRKTPFGESSCPSKA